MGFIIIIIIINYSLFVLPQTIYLFALHKGTVKKILVGNFEEYNVSFIDVKANRYAWINREVSGLSHEILDNSTGKKDRLAPFKLPNLS